MYDEMEEKKKAVNVKVPEKDRKVHTCLVIVTGERNNQILHETCLQGINVVEFVKTNVQFKMANSTTMIQGFH